MSSGLRGTRLRLVLDTNEVVSGLLWGGLLGIDRFNPKAKRQMTQLLDSFIEAEKLKQQMKLRTTPAAKPRAQRNQPSKAKET